MANTNTPPSLSCPAISVIIPMYNAEKYIGECLDSILAQTFKDFEVIVVDDCSTDNSASIVKNYAPKFDGKFLLTRTLNNSGGAAMPRNKAMTLSRGEYIFFIDADDAITPTAFEELYSVAKQTNADVVTCETIYSIPDELWHDDEFRKQLKPNIWRSSKFVTEPAFLTNNLLERLQLSNQRYFMWNIWSKLIRRDLVFENELFFPNTVIDDMIFTLYLICTAERFVLVPSVINYYREMKDSMSHSSKHDEKFYRKYVKVLLTSFRALDKFLDAREVFRQNSFLKHLALEICWSEIFMGYLSKMYAQNAAYEFDKILREELSREENLALSAFNFNAANSYRLQLIRANQHIAALENELERLKKE
ncbi:MAG: glycosyltransferase [Selenomonadaceae bacterium]|nr:glycosyltransferase [Selenomonadaceae bacterium]